MSPAFEVRGVTRRFGAVEALRGVSLHGEPGQVLGLLGPNGAGKTTTVKVLAGLLAPDAGQAFVQGEPAGSLEARAALGYLPEAPRWPEHLTGAELLDREGRLLGLPRAERRGRTALLLDRVGLPGDVFERRLATYSKGEKGRLGLAAALMGDPPVLLLDEPTDGLDPAGKKAARELLRELAREGRAVMLNSHLLGEVEATCDQVVIIKEGRVLAHGPTAELLAAKSAVYRLRLAEPPGDELLAALRATCPDAALQPDGALLLPLEAHEQLDEVVDLLRARGARLRELRPRATLEDVFLELVGQEGGA